MVADALDVRVAHEGVSRVQNDVEDVGGATGFDDVVFHFDGSAETDGVVVQLESAFL